MQADSLVSQLLGGDRLALAQAITRLELGTWEAADWLPLQAGGRKAFSVGLTGSGGAGKSTLAGALVEYLRQRDISTAVLANDPSSPISGGALLGDRVRLEPRPLDPGCYFRSLATRGHHGGISPVVGEAVRLLGAVGFEVVLVETVGVGQDEYAVHSFVDRLVLLLTPGSGDEIQLQKAGLIELADVIVVNKADLPGADVLLAMLRELLPHTPSLPVVANRSQGIEQLWQTLCPATSS